MRIKTRSGQYENENEKEKEKEKDEERPCIKLVAPCYPVLGEDRRKSNFCCSYLLLAAQLEAFNPINMGIQHTVGQGRWPHHLINSARRARASRARASARARVPVCARQLFLANPFFPNSWLVLAWHADLTTCRSD